MWQFFVFFYHYKGSADSAPCWPWGTQGAAIAGTLPETQKMKYKKIRNMLLQVRFQFLARI